jgi:dGTPase
VTTESTGDRAPKVVAYSKKDLEAFEDERLALYACRASRAVRRYPIPAEGKSHDYRTEFQRDRDRIVHSRAFRRPERWRARWA